MPSKNSAGGAKKLVKSTKINVSKTLGKLTLSQRRTQTLKAVRVIKAALAISGKYTRLLPRLKAHDRTNRIPKIETLVVGKFKQNFPPKYRDLWSAQDEFIRTSLVTDLLQGLFGGTLSASDLANVKLVIQDISSVRFPTKWSGFRFASAKSSTQSNIHGVQLMQHPTSAGTGIWDSTLSGGSSAHSALDEARVKVALDSINGFIVQDVNGTVTLAPGTTLETIVKTIIREVGVFTLNNFTGPATASNLQSSATAKENLEQTSVREYWKDKIESLGATRASLPIKVPLLNLPDRPFEPSLNPGQISPRRNTGITVTDPSTF